VRPSRGALEDQGWRCPCHRQAARAVSLTLPGVAGVTVRTSAYCTACLCKPCSKFTRVRWRQAGRSGRTFILRRSATLLRRKGAYVVRLNDARTKTSAGIRDGLFHRVGGLGRKCGDADVPQKRAWVRLMRGERRASDAYRLTARGHDRQRTDDLTRLRRDLNPSGGVRNTRRPGNRKYERRRRVLLRRRLRTAGLPIRRTRCRCDGEERCPEAGPQGV
jgi:hypothetical protein